MKKLWLAAAAATLYLPGGVALAGSPGGAATKIVVIHAASMQSTQTLSGNCFASSIASRRSDAYRCMTGNSIHDPCFSVDGKTVACPTNPGLDSGVRITLTKPLPTANSGSGRNAWMMRLAGGASCNMGTGTVIPDYPFYCTGNLVCAAPASQPGTHSVYVQCGKPKSAMSVVDAGRRFVAVVYE